MASPMDLTIDFGPMPLDAHTGTLTQGLRELWDKSELCDVELIAGGQTFFAHRPVLAAASPSFHECLMQLSSVPDGSEKKTLVLKLGDITHPEAVQAMLECIYGPPVGSAQSYSPGSEEANTDVLRLAQRFQIVQLQSQASGWLIRDLSTANVLQRLVACTEFDLTDVRESILQQIISNPKALWVLANDPEVVKAPVVLQDLLIRVLSMLKADVDMPPAEAQKPAAKAQGRGGARKTGA